jgi:hypothetical protein
MDTDQEILKLVGTTSRIEQAITDMKGTLDRALPFLTAADCALDKRVRKLERKQWYWSGAFAAVGVILGWVAHVFMTPIGR